MAPCIPVYAPQARLREQSKVVPIALEDASVAVADAVEGDEQAHRRLLRVLAPQRHEDLVHLTLELLGGLIGVRAHAAAVRTASPPGVRTHPRSLRTARRLAHGSEGLAKHDGSVRVELLARPPLRALIDKAVEEGHAHLLPARRRVGRRRDRRRRLVGARPRVAEEGLESQRVAPPVPAHHRHLGRLISVPKAVGDDRIEEAQPSELEPERFGGGIDGGLDGGLRWGG